MTTVSNRIVPVILAGGYGTRLASVLGALPKPLAQVCGRPFVTFLLDMLVASGFTRVVFATGHLGEEFPKRLGPKYRSLRLVYSRELKSLGTGGGLRLALEKLPGDCRQVLVMNGDSYAEVAIQHYLEWAETVEHSIIVAKVDDPSRFGRVVIDDENKVLAFQEKQNGMGAVAWINAGVGLLSVNELKKWRVGENFSLEKEFFPGLVKKGGLSAFPVDTSFIDIGIPSDYKRAGLFFKKICVQI